MLLQYEETLQVQLNVHTVAVS